MLKFAVICGTDPEATHQPMLPAIERLLPHPSVQRTCIIKLYRAEVQKCLCRYYLCQEGYVFTVFVYLFVC